MLSSVRIGSRVFSNIGIAASDAPLLALPEDGQPQRDDAAAAHLRG
jgi:hypothetical protein